MISSRLHSFVSLYLLLIVVYFGVAFFADFSISGSDEFECKVEDGDRSKGLNLTEP